MMFINEIIATPKQTPLARRWVGKISPRYEIEFRPGISHRTPGRRKNIATAAERADVLLEGTKLAISAASTIKLAMHPKTPKLMYLLRGKRSTNGIAIALRPKANVSHAAG